MASHGIRDKNGHLEYFGAIQDVTQQVLAETALIEARSELAKLARLVDLGPVAVGIAHEISQPLSGKLARRVLEKPACRFENAGRCTAGTGGQQGVWTGVL